MIKRASRKGGLTGAELEGSTHTSRHGNQKAEILMREAAARAAADEPPARYLAASQ